MSMSMSMYIPASFKEKRIEIMQALMRAHPLGLLVTYGDSGLQASPLPFLLYVDEGECGEYAECGKYGVLRAHMAKANPHWVALAGVSECLVVFQGAEGYVTPSWYPAKSETHKVVPTWNYATVQARGKPSLVEDAQWLRRQLDDLTAVHERPRPRPWSVSDAPAEFIATQMQAIIGIEIPIQRLDGKWKMSQNKSAADRAGVVRGMRSETDPHRNGAVAELIERGGEP